MVLRFSSTVTKTPLRNPLHKMHDEELAIIRNELFYFFYLLFCYFIHRT